MKTPKYLVNLSITLALTVFHFVFLLSLIYLIINGRTWQGICNFTNSFNIYYHTPFLNKLTNNPALAPPTRYVLSPDFAMNMDNSAR